MKEIRSKVIKDDPLYKHPEVKLIDKEQWSYIKKRFRMSERELEISMLICRGFSNMEIAKKLQIKETTVKIHTRNVYRKVNVKNKITLLLKFMEDINKFFN
ncbi:MAG: response regulator transcription factor [Sedimentisphaerales bacterium]|nr:response regulator transcription factor [Sedimentisphaerales bacterium]